MTFGFSVLTGQQSESIQKKAIEEILKNYTSQNKANWSKSEGILNEGRARNLQRN